MSKSGTKCRKIVETRSVMVTKWKRKTVNWAPDGLFRANNLLCTHFNVELDFKHSILILFCVSYFTLFSCEFTLSVLHSFHHKKKRQKQNFTFVHCILCHFHWQSHYFILFVLFSLFENCNFHNRLIIIQQHLIALKVNI